MKYTIGNQNKNDEQLTSAIVNAKDGDIIELLPGTYFSRNSPFICTIRRNITFIGKTNNKEDVRLYCSITVGAQNILIFKNLELIYPADGENTLSAYDGAEVYGDNVSIDRQTADDWDTIYGQNAFFSFKNSEILTGKKTKAIGLSMDNSQLFADKTTFQLLFQKNSIAYLKDSSVLHRLELRRHSKLNFRNLSIDSTQVHTKNDLVVKSHSDINGQQLLFTNNTPNVRILKSHFDIGNFAPTVADINFKFDDGSDVLADGNKPVNHSKKR